MANHTAVFARTADVMATQAPATLLCRAVHCAQLSHDGSGLCPYHLQREYEFKGLGVWELVPAAPLVAPAPPPPSAPLADLTPVPDLKEGDARHMVPSLTGLAPSADLLNYYDVEEQVYRYRTFKSTYTMPPWMRLLLTLLVHSGKITFGDLCLRCAVRRDHATDAYVDTGRGFKLIARRERGDQRDLAMEYRQPDQNGEPGIHRAEQEERPEAGPEQRPALI